jgi:hypothetical protein
MVDRALIFQQITSRNAIRRAAGLPLLDVRAEMAHEVALAIAHDAAEHAAEFSDARLLIRDQVIGDLITQQGRDYTKTMGGRWAIDHETNKRFRAWLLDEHGIKSAEAPARNAVIYGQGNAAVLVEEPIVEPVEATILLFRKPEIKR